ncbi:phytanoyl-CoA dioxygenase family protein [Candidatus Latescibacteria bacterium]|nr:phytanoyl-CoA dioxygenase family protein [Candidatus Latescibacterota bacterium]
MPHLTPSQLDHYRENGYVLVENLLDPATDLDPVLTEYEKVLGELADELFAKKKIASTYADLDFDQRLCQIYNETGQVHAQHFDISLPQGNTTDAPIAVIPSAFAALRNERLLDIIENLIGPEIYSNPVQHIRIKPPEQYLPGIPKDHHGRIAGFAVGATPWHQDNGVVLPEADETDMLTVWMPLTDAFREHGCIEVVAGSHRDGLLHHCQGNGIGLFVQDKHLDPDRVVTAQMKRGDVLFMHRLTCHSSLPNVSDKVRISFDLRYNPTGQPTGRPLFPGFVARSRQDPTSELRDAEAWAQSWYDTREKLSRVDVPTFNRWPSNDPVCA